VYDELKLGDNEFNIKILYQNKPLDKVNVNLKVYKPNGEVVEYNSNKVNDKKTIHLMLRFQKRVNMDTLSHII